MGAKKGLFQKVDIQIKLEGLKSRSKWVQNKPVVYTNLWPLGEGKKVVILHIKLKTMNVVGRHASQKEKNSRII